MNKFIKQVIEEKFASKAQQRLFFAKAKKSKKWSKWAKEFADKTDFKKLPEKAEEDVDEIVDIHGNILRNKKEADFNTKGISDDWTTDEVVKAGAGSMGTHGVHGTHTSLRYWAEADMSKALGYDETLGQDDDYKDAKKYFKKELGLKEPEVEDRLEKMGYDPELPDDKIRLIENPKKFVEEYVDSILKKRNSDNDLVKNQKKEEKELNPIIRRQIKSLKDSMNSHGISTDDVLEYLKDDE
jgi:hypothetical protein